MSPARSASLPGVTAMTDMGPSKFREAMKPVSGIVIENCFDMQSYENAGTRSKGALPCPPHIS